MILVTLHATRRYRERVANVTEAEAREALSGFVFEKAAEFGARFVKLGTGHHAALDQNRVVTVLPKDTWLATLAMCHDGKYVREAI